MPNTARSPRHDADLPPPPLPDLAAVSLFVDLDGTIAPLEATPQAVAPDQARRRLLDALASRLGGRLAVVSGRTLDDLDRVLEGRVTALAGVHGLARRRADGAVIVAAPTAAMAEAVEDLRAFAVADPALLVEDKGIAAALHYRLDPAAGPACRDLAQRLGERLGLIVQLGDMVCELRAPGADKGAAVAAFMDEGPFEGHLPIVLGDDLTDEDGFRAARRLGGFGVVVGARRPTQASYALGGVDAVRAWLRAALDRPSAEPAS